MESMLKDTRKVRCVGLGDRNDWHTRCLIDGGIWRKSNSSVLRVALRHPYSGVQGSPQGKHAINIAVVQKEDWVKS